MERREALRRVLFLKTLPDDVIDSIAASAHERILQKGELLFSENGHCLGLIVVTAGAVKEYKLDNRGRELTLGLESAGSSVAELPFV